MAEDKTFIFPEGVGSGSSSVDAGLIAALNNGGMGGFNNPFWAIILLALIGRNGFGWNNNGGDPGCNTAFVSSQLGQAIAGNANALSNLSTELGCSISQVQAGISGLQAAIANAANQSGMSSMQVINAVNSGNATIQNTLQSCCCNITNAVNTGFGNLRYENAAQACDVKQSIAGQTASVLAKLDAIEDSRKDREISNLTAQLTAANSRAERQAELAPIYKALSDIQCKQPSTTTIPYSPVTAVPNCIAWQYGLNGLGLSPFAQGGSIWS